MEIKTLAGVCIVKNNKILLLKQSANEVDGTAGAWGPPAGHGEEGENLQQTAIREAKEESSLDVKLTGFIEIGLYKISDGRNYLIAIFMAEVLNIEDLKVDGHEVIDYKWVGKEELKSGNLVLRHPILKLFLIRAIEKKVLPLNSFSEVSVEV